MKDDSQRSRRGHYGSRLTRRDSERRTLFRRTSLSRRIKFDASKRQSPEMYYDGPRSQEDRAQFRATVRRAMEDVDHAISVLSRIEKGNIKQIDNNTAALIKNNFDIFNGDLRMNHVKALKNSYEQIKSHLNDKDFLLKIDTSDKSITEDRDSMSSYFNRNKKVTVRISTADALVPEIGAHALIQGIARQIKSPPGHQKLILGEAFTGALADPSNFSDFAGALRASRDVRQQAVARQKTQYKLAQEIITGRNARLTPEEREKWQKEISEKLRKALYNSPPPIAPDEERLIREQVSRLGGRMSEADFEKQTKAIWGGEKLDKASLIENPQKYFEDRLSSLRAIADSDKRYIEAQVIRDDLFEVYKAKRIGVDATVAVKGELDRLAPARPNHVFPAVSPIMETLPPYTAALSTQQPSATSWNVGVPQNWATASPMQGYSAPVQPAAPLHAQAAYLQQLAAQTEDLYGPPIPAAPAHSLQYPHEEHEVHDFSQHDLIDFGQNDHLAYSNNYGIGQPNGGSHGRDITYDDQRRAAQRTLVRGG